MIGARSAVLALACAASEMRGALTNSEVGDHDYAARMLDYARCDLSWAGWILYGARSRRA